MATRRLRLLSLLVTAILAFGACTERSERDRWGGRALRRPAPGPGPKAGRTSRFPTSRTASSTSRWSSSARTTTAAGARPTTRACSTSARTSPTAHVAYIENVPEGRRLRAGVPEPGAQGLQLHHRHVVRLHGPDGGRRRGVPGHHLPPPDRVQVERHELRQLLRRDGGLQVPRRHARRVAGQEGRQSQDRLHGDVPDPGGAPPRQRDHARRQEDLPRVHDGHPLHQHLARPGQGEGRRRVAVRRRRPGRVHRRRHRCRRGRRPGEGQVGGHLRPPGVVQGRRAA